MSLDISRGSWPQSNIYFGHADYTYHRGQGKTAQYLLDWVNSNFSKFSPGPKNQPGGGGLYDQMVADASAERAAADQARRLEQQRIADQAALDKIVSGYEEQMRALNESMMAQQAQYETNIGGMTNTLKETQDSLLASQNQLLSSQQAFEESQRRAEDAATRAAEREAAMTAAQQKMQLKMNAQMNPNTRAKNMGVKGAAKSGVQQQAMKRQGMTGQFGREGLRIKGINV